MEQLDFPGEQSGLAAVFTLCFLERRTIDASVLTTLKDCVLAQRPNSARLFSMALLLRLPSFSPR